MGSLFMVGVPVRDHEATLRQKEHNIQVIDAQVMTDETGRSLSGGNIVGSGNSIHIPVSSGNNSLVDSSLGEDVDVYEAMADGKRARIIVSTDSMQILNFTGSSSEMIKFGGPVVHKKMSQNDSELISKIENMFLEKHLEDCIQKFGIMSACWGTSVDGSFSQVAFTVSDEKSESIINLMQTLGIGHKYNSSLCVCTASVYEEADVQHKDLQIDADSADGDAVGKKNKWNDFVSSIKSRLTVAQVVQTVRSNAIMTFDFIMLIIVAGMIAGLGLIDDSSVNVVASMLVSPLMGPIMATTFGAVIRDIELVKTGLTSELVGLSICLVVGYVFGILLQIDVWDGGPWSAVDKWPTDQMRGRSELRSLMVGVGVAIPSGVGVALSILAGNSGSLVGVAISASLLPPAVNCGILWGLATVMAIQESLAGKNPLLACGSKIDRFHGNRSMYTINYKEIYCVNPIQEFARMGIVSFGLTWLNIILIFLVGVLILKIKEVAPHTTRKGLSRFWKEDLKIVRELNQRGGGQSMNELMEDLDQTGQKDEILKKMETDMVFNQVNRRTGITKATSILNDVKRKPGSTFEKSSSQDQAKPPTTTKSQATWGNWISGFFGGGPKPTDVELNAGNDGKRARPKLM